MPHWLDQYANNHHAWRESNQDGHHHFYRPLGLVETGFDTDGVYFEGRADINALLELDINSRLTNHQLRRRIGLAWTSLRLNHVLLMSKAVDKEPFMISDQLSRRFFLTSCPSSAQAAIQDALNHLVFTGHHYNQVDSVELYRHAQNTGRVFESSQALAKLFVLPLESHSSGITRLSFLFVISHQIADGLTNYNWLKHFLGLLNTPIADLEHGISTLSSRNAIRTRLPLPQEDLYPRISGSRAKERWFWLLTLVLRHVKTPMPPAFPNPLRRSQPLRHARPMPPTYDKLLNYTKTPPLNSFTCNTLISKSSVQRLHRLCREAGASIGAGCFVLVAMVMMSIYESRFPNIPLSSRKSFIGGFPVNPRPFFNHAEPPDSMMLAFSDGVVLPFLPSHLDIEGRFKVLVRQANRQLSLYQKRVKKLDNNPELEKAYMGSRGAGRVIAMNYISAIERMRAKLPPHLKDSIAEHSPQGDLPASVNPTMATCGVSSVGKIGWQRGEYDINTIPSSIGNEKQNDMDAFVADFREIKQNVRVRDGEFLVGVGGMDEGIFANVSFDGNAIDEEWVGEWKKRMESLLDENTGGLSKL